MIKIFHLSDLHIVKDADWNNLRALLLRTAKEEFKDLPKENKLLIITGDFHVFPEQDFDKAAEFIRELVKAMGISMKKDVFLIPGNHDMSLSDDPCQKKYQQAFVSCVKNDLSELQEDNSIEMLLSSFKKYNEFCVKLGLYNVTGNPSQVHVRLWRKQLNILHINTCLVADGVDKQNQLADSKAITKIQINNGLPGIALGHNSFFDLHKDIRVAITALFARADIRAYLCGDQHRIVRDRELQLIRLGSGLNNLEAIPNVLCCRSTADVKDDYSDIGCIIHSWNESTGSVNLDYLLWYSKTDQNKFEHRIENNAYKLKPSEKSKSAKITSRTIEPRKEVKCYKYFDNLETPHSKNYYGRQELLDNIEKQLVEEEKSVICLHGAAFEGKSALVFQLAKKLDDHKGRGFEFIIHWKFRVLGGGDSLSNTNLSQFLEVAMSIFGKSKTHEDDFTRMQTLLRIMDEKRVLLILENLEIFQEASGQFEETNQLIKSVIQKFCRTRSNVGSAMLLTSRLPVAELEHYENRTANIRLPKLTAEECSEIFKENGIKGTPEQLREASQELGCSPFAAVLVSSILNEKYDGLITRRREIHDLNSHYSSDNELNIVTCVLKYYESLWKSDSLEFNMLLLLSLFRHSVTFEQLVGVAEKVDRFKSLAFNGTIKNTSDRLKRAGLISYSPIIVEIQTLFRSYYYQQFKQLFPMDFKKCNKIIADNMLSGFVDENVSNVVDAMPLYDAIYHYAEAEELEVALDIYRNRLNRGREFFSQKVLGAFCNDLGAVSSFFLPDSDWKPKDGLEDDDTAWLCSSAAYLLNLLGATRDSESLRRHEIEIHEKRGNKKLLVSDLLNLVSNLMIQTKFVEAEKMLLRAESQLPEIQEGYTDSRYEDKISIELLNNRLLITKAQLTFWKSRENKQEILSSLQGISDKKQLPVNGRFSYLFLMRYCQQQIKLADVKSLLESKGTPYATAYAYAIYAIEDYYNGKKDSALSNVERAVDNASIANRLDQLPVILLLRLYLYYSIRPNDVDVFFKTGELEEIQNIYGLNLHTAEFNILRLGMLIDAGKSDSAHANLTEIDQCMDYYRYYHDRLQTCREKLKRMDKGRKSK